MAKKKTSQRSWMIATVIVGALLLVSLLLNAVLFTLMAVGNDGTAPTQAGQPNEPTAPSPSGTVEVSADDDPMIGNPDAKVQVIEFSDYECPFCARFWRDTYPTIKEDYIDTGKISFVYRDFPLENIHPRATPAAIAAECVQELEGDEAYFDMHDLIFANQQSLSDQDLRTYAVQAGVNGAQFDECYADEDGEMAAEVQADLQAGQQAGVTGTPTVFVNGEKIVGAQPLSVFTAAIDAALAE